MSLPSSEYVPVDHVFAPVVAIMGLGTVELIIVGAVILLLFGARLPKVMRSLGEGIVEFKRGVQGIEDESRRPGSGDGEHASPR